MPVDKHEKKSKLMAKSDSSVFMGLNSLSNTIYNAMSGTINSIKVNIFDIVTVDSVAEGYQTTLLIESNDLLVPSFKLTPRAILFDENLGIDTPDYPELFQKYELKVDVYLQPPFLTKKFAEYFVQNNFYTVEGFHNTLIVYKCLRTIKSRDMNNFLNAGLEIFELFRQHSQE